MTALSLLAPDLLAQRGAPPARRSGPALAAAPGGPTAAATTTPAAASAGQRPVVLLTGYWPPTNEAVRRFSPKPSLNPVWEGSDWMGRGYDVVSFFPEFGNPSCTFCGRGTGDLEVDYQDTTEDFQRIVEAYRPIAIITFSRGANNTTWEVEANQFNRAAWVGDYSSPFQPTPAPPDPSIDADAIRHTALPAQDIVDAIAGSGVPVQPFICYSQSGGGFLSEYIAYLGVWYQARHADPAGADWCVAAGHVHVGGQVPWSVASDAVDVTLEAVLDHVDGVLACPPMEPYCGSLANSAYGGAELMPIGAPSIAAGGLELVAQRVVPFQAGLLFYGPGRALAPLGDGQLCVAGPLHRLPGPVSADHNGVIRFELDYAAPPLGVGPGAVAAGTTWSFQTWFRDPGGALGSNSTNALEITFCP